MELTEQDSGGSFTASVGELIVVALSEVATSGYQWEAQTDESFLRAQPPADQASEPRGGARLAQFGFEALKPGRVQLRLVNRRPWEDKPPVGEFVAQIDIV